ncbi:hypothetical protein SLS56_009683 [Neofusicoccum ribis]|uniref:Uncharacterized protein n=1 Tax=Neofusicoccum ribis TaxID=45134 RepID=A0ABR3SGM0_9PEZI
MRAHFSSSLLIFLNLLVAVLAAGPLQVTLFENGSNGAVFTSKLTVKGGTGKLSDGQISDLARTGYGEMIDICKQKGSRFWDKKRPTTMGALAVGNEIYLSSAFRGEKGSFIINQADSKNPMKDCLQTCAKEQGNVNHKNQGNCAECVAMYLWYKDHGNTAKLADQSARVVAVYVEKPLKRGDQFSPNDVKIFDPCGATGDKWGCDLVTKKEKVKAIKNASSSSSSGGAFTPYDPKAISGTSPMSPFS